MDHSFHVLVVYFRSSCSTWYFYYLLGAILFGFNALEASSIGIIGGADGPTAIFLSNKLLTGTDGGAMLCASIAVVAYSYMALVPVIQPPIIKALTSKRNVKLKWLNQEWFQEEKKLFFRLL